jgi:hypothetical protein
MLQTSSLHEQPLASQETLVLEVINGVIYMTNLNEKIRNCREPYDKQAGNTQIHYTKQGEVIC